MVRCTILGCKRKAKFKGKSLCFVHLHNKTHVEVTMPFEIDAPKKRGRKKKVQFGDLTNSERFGK